MEGHLGVKGLIGPMVLHESFKKRNMISEDTQGIFCMICNIRLIPTEILFHTSNFQHERSFEIIKKAIWEEKNKHKTWVSKVPSQESG